MSIGNASETLKCFLSQAQVDKLDAIAAGATKGQILQVKSKTKPDTATIASATFAALTGMSISITPISTSSKIYICVMAHIAHSNDSKSIFLNLMRGSTEIGRGDAAGSRIRCSFAARLEGSTLHAAAFNFLDAPATTSPIAYNLEWARGETGTGYFNRTASDTDDANHPRPASTITVMEVKS